MKKYYHVYYEIENCGDIFTQYSGTNEESAKKVYNKTQEYIEIEKRNRENITHVPYNINLYINTGEVPEDFEEWEEEEKTEYLCENGIL